MYNAEEVRHASQVRSLHENHVSRPLGRCYSIVQEDKVNLLPDGIPDGGLDQDKDLGLCMQVLSSFWVRFCIVHTLTTCDSKETVMDNITCLADRKGQLILTGARMWSMIMV